jgi:hypothetical protein
MVGPYSTCPVAGSLTCQAMDADVVVMSVAATEEMTGPADGLGDGVMVGVGRGVGVGLGSRHIAGFASLKHGFQPASTAGAEDRLEVATMMNGSRAARSGRRRTRPPAAG